MPKELVDWCSGVMNAKLQMIPEGEVENWKQIIDETIEELKWDKKNVLQKDVVEYWENRLQDDIDEFGEEK